MSSPNTDNSQKAWNDLWENYAKMQDAVPGTVWRRGLLLRLLNQYTPILQYRIERQHAF